MQFQADMLGVPLHGQRIAETTALGAAFAAGLGAGYWKSVDDIKVFFCSNYSNSVKILH